MAGTFIGEPWKQPYTAKQLQDAATHQVPIIGANGNFWRWDIATSAYVDTGVLAGAGLPDGSVTTPKLADGAVTWPKLAPEARKSNDNLLDNWYFVGGGSQQGGGQFPINQRELTEYTGAIGYFIDRWRKDDGASVSLAADGLKFTRASAGDNAFYQYIENFSGILGQVLTASALVKGTPGTAVRLGYNIGAGGIYGDWVTLDGTWQLVSHTYIAPSTATSFAHLIRYRVTGNFATDEVLLAAAKLELGPYQTLAYESAGGGGN